MKPSFWGLLLFAIGGTLSHSAAASAPPGPQMPTLLRPGLMTAAEICADARRREPDKKLALIALKTHLCDLEREGHSCLHVLRTIADPCNRFLRDNFALYHTRLFRCLPAGGDCVETPGSDELSTIWGNGGPDLIALDLRSCREIGRTGPGIEGYNLPQAADRIAAMRAQLLRKVPSLRALPEPEPSCPADPEGVAGRADLMDIWRLLEN